MSQVARGPPVHRPTQTHLVSLVADCLAHYLSPCDISLWQFDYPSFTRDFYSEHEDISSLTSADVKDLRAKLGLKVTGYQPPKPCISFAHFNFDTNVMNIIRKMEYSQPTGIQAQVS